MPSFKTMSAKAVAVLLIASLGGQTILVQGQAACNADNCLRALRNTAVISRARVFCSAYTAGSFGNAPLPTYVAGCRVSAPAISSACSCIATTTTTARPTTPTPTTTRSTTTPIATTSAPGACVPVTSYITVTNTAASTCPPLSTPSCPPPPPTSSCPPPPPTSSCPPAAYYGPPGSELVPNALFENDPPVWENVGEGFPHKLVNISADGSFSGAIGPRMLKYETSESSSFLDVKVRVPAVEKPHPDGRDWRVTAWFRTDANTVSNCWPIIGTSNLNTGNGNGFQPDSKLRAWTAISFTIDNSAGGTPSGQVIYVAGGCYPSSGFVYIDGVYIS